MDPRLTMTDNFPLPGQPAGWLLWAEFADARVPGSRGELLPQVMGALQGLNLRSQQRGRIQTLFSRAVARAAREEEPAPLSPIRVRIWLLRSCADDCGWSFFLVETMETGSGSAAAAETGHLVQLFLYQERDS
jgi:hypothetical protein